MNYPGPGDIVVPEDESGMVLFVTDSSPKALEEDGRLGLETFPHHITEEMFWGSGPGLVVRSAHYGRAEIPMLEVLVGSKRGWTYADLVRYV